MTARILRSILPLGSLLLAASIGACGGDASRSTALPAGSASVFQLTSCSLGCSSGGCAATKIFTNQDIQFLFNDAVDENTVSFTTLSLVDRMNGSSPAGEFLVSFDALTRRGKVVFRPALLETNTGILFGFVDGADYDMELFALPLSNTIRSSIGRPNTTPLNCTVRTEGIKDLVPGRPSVSFTPNATQPPTSRTFVVEMVFNDLMEKGQLVDPETGQSPFINVVILDSSQGQTVETQVAGTYSAVLDRDRLITTVTFTPIAPFPGNGGSPPVRQLRLDFDANISDLAGNLLDNAGSYLAPLPNSTETPGSFQEFFADTSQLDPGGSVSGLWAASSGVLDSGLDPDAMKHRGGGSGVLGKFQPSLNITLDTDSMVLTTDDIESPLDRDLTINGGVFMFDEVFIPSGVTVSATGSNPLRIFSRGDFVVEGTLDLNGQDAPDNFGKYFPKDKENVDGEDQGNMIETEADGGDPGLGALGGGSGGQGGASWYVGFPNYYDGNPVGTWQSGTPNPGRFMHGIPRVNVIGKIGEGVGGRAPLGEPLFVPAEIITDRSYGSGMGSWAWPPKSDTVEDPVLGDVLIESYLNTFSGQFTNISLHRARGGGGGGFWTDGQAGIEFDAAGIDPLGQPLVAPRIDAPNGVHEFNDLWAFDVNPPGTATVPDAGGGQFDPANFPGIETLDPDALPDSLLLGGAGGGGAGNSEHGSWNDAPSPTRGTIDTYRSCDGAGGGAGGGAAQIQVGSRLSVAGTIRAKGGDGGSSAFMAFIPYTPSTAISICKPGDAGGGGGSGGSLLIEVNGGVGQMGPDSVVVSGGQGGVGSAGNRGGDGGAGVVRFETATGSEPLATLQTIVDPDPSVALGPLGMPSVANVAAYDAVIPDPVGDLSEGGVVFNGNASGVRSLFYAAAANFTTLTIVDYSVTVEWDDDGVGAPLGVQTYDSTSFPVPGIDPIWISLQTAWGTDPANPLFTNKWVIPGFDATGGGLPLLQAGLWRMIRYRVVFDQDIIQALIGANPAAYFRVTDVRIDWKGE